MIIALSNRKGGCGKTAISATLLSMLPNSLGIDLDTQCCLTEVAGVETETETDANIFSVISGALPPEKAIQHTYIGDLIAGSAELATIHELPFLTLKEKLQGITGKYKHIILDCPPSLDAIVLNALSAADMLIILILPDMHSLRGAGQLGEIIDIVRQEVNPTLQIGGLLMTRYQGHPLLNRKMRELACEQAENLGTKVFDSVLRESVILREAHTMHIPLSEYAPKKPITEDFQALIRELGLA